MATYANINWGRWCRECSTGLGERICRAYFEQMFSQKFPRSRPPWLCNRDGYQMELDGYSEALALAFEHQGRQHFREVDFFHSAEQFKKRKLDDMRKRTLCRRHGVTLIQIPQIPDYLPLSDVQHYILEQCRKRGYEVHLNVGRVKVKLRRAYSPSERELFQTIREIASAIQIEI